MEMEIEEIYAMNVEDLNTVHFLHIGKCAGTTIRVLIDEINQKSGYPKMVAHPHRTTLADLWASSDCPSYFFSIRNPITRFYSGFYSRKRKGLPRIYVEWSDLERQAFEYFNDANDLAENLFKNSALGIEASSAMQSIRHVKDHQHSWFNDFEEIFHSRKPICILRQENLTEDVQYLFKKLNIVEKINLETDKVKAHKNDYSNKPPLSELAIENLKIWYAKDIIFYDLANNYIEINQQNL